MALFYRFLLQGMAHYLYLLCCDRGIRRYDSYRSVFAVSMEDALALTKIEIRRVLTFLLTDSPNVCYDTS